VIELAVEIAREGREGRRIGTLFTKELRSIRNSNLRGTLKELAQLDGAFIFDDSSVLVAGCRYLDAKRPISSYEWDLAVVISQLRQFPR
jgi:diadenylate cyclase